MECNKGNRALLIYTHGMAGRCFTVSRWADIDELLRAVRADVSTLRMDYELAKQDEKISQVSRVKVKSSLEHLRSCLEYSAQEIHDRVFGGKPPKKLYFPYSDTENKFNNQVNGAFAGLKQKAPKVFSLIESLQPHKCASSWLLSLCKATNDNKHICLSKQDRHNSAVRVIDLNGVRVSGSGEGGVIFKDCTFNGVKISGDPLIVDFKSSIDVTKSRLPKGFPVSQTYESVQFRIKGSTEDLLSLIEFGLAEIEKFTSELRKALDK
jgi:hypothetical protein